MRIRIRYFAQTSIGEFKMNSVHILDVYIARLATAIDIDGVAHTIANISAVTQDKDRDRDM